MINTFYRQRIVVIQLHILGAPLAMAQKKSGENSPLCLFTLFVPPLEPW